MSGGKWVGVGKSLAQVPGTSRFHVQILVFDLQLPGGQGKDFLHRDRMQNNALTVEKNY